jgi:hypothetical protein
MPRTGTRLIREPVLLDTCGRHRPGRGQGGLGGSPVPQGCECGLAGARARSARGCGPTEKGCDSTLSSVLIFSMSAGAHTIWWETDDTPNARVAEWQTRWIQVPVPARAWGFNSPLAHQEKPTKRVLTSDESPGGARFSLLRWVKAWTVTWLGPDGEVSHCRGPAFCAADCSPGWCWGGVGGLRRLAPGGRWVSSRSALWSSACGGFGGGGVGRRALASQATF